MSEPVQIPDPGVLPQSAAQAAFNAEFGQHEYCIHHEGGSTMSSDTTPPGAETTVLPPPPGQAGATDNGQPEDFSDLLASAGKAVKGEEKDPLGELEGRVEGLETSRDTDHASIEELREEVTGLRTDLATTKAQNQALNNELASMKRLLRATLEIVRELGHKVNRTKSSGK